MTRDEAAERAQRTANQTGCPHWICGWTDHDDPGKLNWHVCSYPEPLARKTAKFDPGGGEPAPASRTKGVNAQKGRTRH